jgi:hypothetical protein
MKKHAFIALLMLLSCTFCVKAATYSYLNAPNGSYPDSTGSELTDGYLPVLMDGTPWGDAGWVGFADVNPVIVFDLGASQSIAAIKLYCFGGTGGISVPSGATISFSEDGTTFSGDVTYGAFNTPSNMVSWTQIITSGKSGRYVKIQLTSAGQWLFIGEIQVLESLPITYSYSSGTPNGSYPDSTGSELTDRYLPVVPSSGQSWSDTGWVGFANTNPSIIFDLAESQNVNAIKLYCFGGTAGINVPAGASVSFSDDGSTWSSAITYGAFNTPGSSYVSWTVIPTSGSSGRYVKIELTSAGEWLFIGEVQFLQTIPVLYSYNGTSPNGQYPDSGEELTDGYLPVIPSSGESWSDTGWVGFANTNPSIIFDLAVSQEISSVKLYCFGGTAGINVPAGASISFSEDGTTWSSAVTYGAFTTPAGSYMSWTIIPTPGSSGRYVKVDLTSAGQWLFIGEAEFLQTIPVSYSYTTVSPHGGYPDSGEELTDSYLPGQDFTDSGWVGFENSNPTIVFDQGVSKNVNAVKFYCFSGNAGITAPAGAIVSFSEDGTTYSGAVTYGAFASLLNGYTTWTTIPTPGKSGRYVKIELTSSGQWIFIGEVQFIPYPKITTSPAPTNGTNSLIMDGQTNGGSWASGNYAGWHTNAHDIVSIKIDRGVIKSLGGIKLFYNGLYAPYKTTISFAYAANPGSSDWFSPIVKSGDWGSTSDAENSVTFLTENIARWVKIDIENYNVGASDAWCFIDEIQLIEGVVLEDGYSISSMTTDLEPLRGTLSQITDGNANGGSWGSGNYCGWNTWANEIVNVYFDLGTVQNIGEFVLYYNREYRPYNLNLYFSDEDSSSQPSTWSNQVSVPDTQWASRADSLGRAQADFSVQARWVKMEILNYYPGSEEAWCFIDEVVFAAPGSIAVKYPTIIDAVRGTPTIDGDSSDWAGISSDVQSQNVQYNNDIRALSDASWVIPSTVNCSRAEDVKYAWDDNYLYILVQETNADTDAVEGANAADWLSSPYNKDMVGLFNLPNTATTSIAIGMASDGQARVAQQTTSGFTDYASFGGQAAVSKVDGKRIVEAALPWSVVLASGSTPAAGMQFECDPLIVDAWSNVTYTWVGQSFIGGGLWALNDAATYLFPKNKNITNIRLKYLLSDTSNDSRVDMNDLFILASQWLLSCDDMHCNDTDLNRDGQVNFQDLAKMGLDWAK